MSAVLRHGEPRASVRGGDVTHRCVVPLQSAQRHLCLLTDYQFVASRIRGLTPSARLLWLLAALAFFRVSSLAAAEPNLGQREEDAIRAALDRVAPSVVTIQTVGGTELADGALPEGGMATGLIVSPDGLMVSSAYTFARRPTAILVTIGDKKNVPAQLVATDRSRAITLLKVDLEPGAKLLVPEAAPPSAMLPGAWAIAVARTLDPQHPNVSVGIISAVERNWSKAIQTDAKISPANYGGPLIDIHGRVLGVLVPMSPMESGETAGAEWYDSGIGFAVPLADIFKMVPKLAAGQDLHPGLLGVALRDKELFAQPPVIAACRPGTPAYEAGLRRGDRIVAVAGRDVSNQAQMRHLVGPLYAGEKVRMTVERDKQRIDAQITLAEKLPPYKQAMLGALPTRMPDKMPGVVIRHVFADGAADKAGIRTGDRIEKIDGQAVKDLASAREILDMLAPRQKVEIVLQRQSKPLTISVALGGTTEAIPAELPPAVAASATKDKPAAAAVIDVKIPELSNNCFAYVPPQPNGTPPLGLLIALDLPGKFDKDQAAAAWKPYCDRTGTILLMPRPRDADRWQSDEVELLVRAAGQVVDKYEVDTGRIAAVGRQGGGVLALLTAFARLGMVHGVAAIDAALPPSASPPAVEPPNRLALLLAHPADGPVAASVSRQIPRLRELGYPVTELTLERVGGNLNGGQQQAVERWLDSLDRF